MDPLLLLSLIVFAPCIGALVLVFVVLTAWKVQYLKEMHRHGIECGSHDRAMGIFGALTLYLSFINLFLLILKILGRSRD